MIIFLDSFSFKTEYFTFKQWDFNLIIAYAAIHNLSSDLVTSSVLYFPRCRMEDKLKKAYEMASLESGGKTKQEPVVKARHKCCFIFDSFVSWIFHYSIKEKKRIILWEVSIKNKFIFLYILVLFDRPSQFFAHNSEVFMNSFLGRYRLQIPHTIQEFNFTKSS